MKSNLIIYEDRMEFQSTDSIQDLIYLKRIKPHLVEIGINIKVSSNLTNKESIILEYIDTSLFMKDEVAGEFLSFLSIDYRTVGVFMKFSEGKHPVDCLTNLFMKYCREYQKKTISVYDYLKIHKNKDAGKANDSEENILMFDCIKEIEVHYETESTQTHFECDSIWIDEDGAEIANNEISLFLNEQGMKTALLTFLNPCLIEQD